MNIVVISNLPPEFGDQKPKLPQGMTQGGGETGPLRYAQRLSESGHYVVFVTGKYEGITKDKLRVSDKFQIQYYPFLFRNDYIRAFSPLLFFRLIFGKFDGIECNQITTFLTLTSCIAAKIKNVNSIVVFRGSLPYSWLSRWFAKWIGHVASFITVQNKFAYDLVSKYIPKDKIVIIPHGVDTTIFKLKKPNPQLTAQFKPTGNEKVILFVGRLKEAKGIDVLLKAVRDMDNIKVIIVGEGELKPYLVQLTKELSMEQMVHFAGLIGQADLPDYYNIADVFVLPSTYYDHNGKYIPNVSENFGLVLAEAMACGVPVIASNMGGIPNWVKDGYNGLLCEERNIDDFAKNIIRILSNNDLRKKLISNALEEITDKYSLDIVVKHFQKLYL